MAFRARVIYGCSPFCLLSVCLLSTPIVARDLPKYKHSEYPTQLCYKCPPGYKFEGECEVSVDGSSPQWSKCTPCETGKYQDSWNVNPRCKPRNQCTSGHVDLSNDSENKLTGPVCACRSRYIEDDRGECVQGVTKSESDEFVQTNIAKAREEDVAKCDKRIATIQSMSPSTRTTEKRTLCTTIGPPTTPYPCPDISMLWWVIVFVSILAIASFAVNILQFCKCRKVRARKERDNDSFKSGFETSNNNIELRQRRHTKEPILYDKGDYQNGARNSRVSSNAGLQEGHPLLEGRDAVPVAVGAAPDTGLDKALRILENRIRPHPEELDRLMRNVFEFTANECEEIKAMPQDTPSKIRCAFTKWKSRRGADGVALVRALGKNKWNDVAEEIANALGVERMAADTEAVDELDEATKVCEERIGQKSDAIKFVRYLGGKFDNSNMSRVEIIREGVRIWRQQQASKATVRGLLHILHKIGFVDVAHAICDKLRLPSDRAFLVRETSVPSQEDKAAPMYNPQEQPNDGTVREMAQPTVDAGARSRRSRPISHSDSASADTGHRSFSQTNDSFAIKLDDEDNGKTIMDVDYIDERDAGDGKEPRDQLSKKHS